jgi:hypothetical protein
MPDIHADPIGVRQDRERHLEPHGTLAGPVRVAGVQSGDVPSVPPGAPRAVPMAAVRLS